MTAFLKPRSGDCEHTRFDLNCSLPRFCLFPQRGLDGLYSYFGCLLLLEGRFIPPSPKIHYHLSTRSDLLL